MPEIVNYVFYSKQKTKCLVKKKQSTYPKTKFKYFYNHTNNSEILLVMLLCKINKSSTYTNY